MVWLCSSSHALALAHASKGGKCKSRISFPMGERSKDLHKRSAEDKGGSCARQERSASARLGFRMARLDRADLLLKGFGAGLGGALAQGVEIAGPLHRACQGPKHLETRCSG